jgi:CheY-like chemotaxis protein
MTEPIAITPQSLAQSAKLSVSDSGQLIAADPGLYDILGWPATELIGHRLAELVHRTDLQKLSDYLADPLTKGHSVDLRFTHRTEGWCPCHLTHLEEASAFELSLDYATRTDEDTDQRSESARFNHLPLVSWSSSSIESISQTLEARAGATPYFVVLDEEVRLCFISPALLRQLNQREADLLTLEPRSIPTALGIQCDLEKERRQLLHALYQGEQFDSLEPPVSLEPTLNLDRDQPDAEPPTDQVSIESTEATIYLVHQLPEPPSTALAPAGNELINESVSTLATELRGTLNHIAEQVRALGEKGLDPTQSQPVEHISHQTDHATKLNDALSLLATFGDTTEVVVNPGECVSTAFPLMQLLWSPNEPVTLSIEDDDLLVRMSQGPWLCALLNVLRSLQTMQAADSTLVITVKRTIADDMGSFLFEEGPSGRLAQIGLSLEGPTPMVVDSALRSLPPQRWRSNSKDAAERAACDLRDVVQSLNGSLDCEATASSLMLTITLPDVSESAIDPARETASNQVLLIEDDTGVRDLVVIFLESIGLDVSSIQSEEELRALPETNYRLIVSDVMLPGIHSGPDLVRMVRRTQPEVPCLFISGYKQGVLTDEDMAHQHTAFLPKPFSKSAFLSKVDECLSLPAT